MSTGRTPEEAATARADSRPRVALGVTGGIAAYKAAEILRGLQRAGCTVRVAMTEHATKLIAPLTFRALSGQHVVVDDYAPDNPDPIAHITFSQTVDLFVVAPATANVIAKFANGVADDFLTTTYLACTAPVLVAPAMNTTMWEHPATRRNLERLRADGVHVVEPDAGEMACGTIGPGRLSAPEIIVAAALEILNGNASRFGTRAAIVNTGGASAPSNGDAPDEPRASVAPVGRLRAALAVTERGSAPVVVIGRPPPCSSRHVRSSGSRGRAGCRRTC